MLHKTIQLTDNIDVTLTIYVQEPSKELSNVSKRPGILILPGGGYEFCSDREAEPIALAYLKEGYNAFVLRYSVKEHAKFPQPLKDAEKALELIREKHELWHTYPDKIACIGFSAGGHLAASLGCSQEQRPNALLLGYGAFIRSDKDGWSFPTPQPDKDTPPTFLFHTFEDSVVPIDTSLFFANELQKLDIPFELHIYQKGVHGLSLGNDIVSNNYKNFVEPHYQSWLKLSIEWLNDLFDCFKTENEW